MFTALFAHGEEILPPDRASAKNLLDALTPFAKADEKGHWRSQSALIVHAMHHNMASSLHEQCPQTCERTGRVIASWLRLDNRDDLCAQLALAPSEILTDPMIVLAAYDKWGRDCCTRLEGDFSFVIHDPTKGETFCARDAIGAKPFYFCFCDGIFVAATSVAAIRAVRGIKLSPNLQWAAMFASAFVFADNETAYEQIAKLPPGHDMLVTKSKRPHPRRYFEFDLAAPHASRRDEIWVDRYRQVFERAVDTRARSDFLIAADNSAGLDSASIIARLVKVLPHPRSQFHTFSMVAYDREMQLLDELAALCRLEQEHRIIEPAMLVHDDSVRRAIKVIGHPPEHGQALLNTSFFDEVSSLGIRTMLSGYGGDEIVTHTAKHLVDELLAQGDYAAVFREIEGTMPRRIARFAKRVIKGPQTSDAATLDRIDIKLWAACLSREFIEDTGLRGKIERWLVPPRPELTLNTLTAFDAGFQLERTARLDASALIAASFGVEYRYPLFDRRLIQQYLSTPSIEKRNRSMGRYLHRRAISGQIPDGIAWQRSKSMGAPRGGRIKLAPFTRIGFDELPAQFRNVFDPCAFDAVQSQIEEAGDPITPELMRARYSFWHIGQLIMWWDAA